MVAAVQARILEQVSNSRHPSWTGQWPPMQVHIEHGPEPFHRPSSNHVYVFILSSLQGLKPFSTSLIVSQGFAFQVQPNNFYMQNLDPLKTAFQTGCPVRGSKTHLPRPSKVENVEMCPHMMVKLVGLLGFLGENVAVNAVSPLVPPDFFAARPIQKLIITRMVFPSTPPML